jgi:hypothetical protein
MKYAAIALLFLLGNEIFSLIALNVIVVMFLGDCVKERFF